MKFGKSIGLAFAATLLAGAAQAATVTFAGGPPGGAGYTEAGFVFDDVRIQNGQCDSGSGRPCAAFNNNETSTMTKVGGGTFNLSGFWFQLLGNGTDNTLSVMTDIGTRLYAQSVWGNNLGGDDVDTSGDAYFQGISFVKFSSLNGGNIRVDDIGASGTSVGGEVPLPAAGWMLLAGLGGLLAMRRKS